jgi:uncharacterized protein (UPF0332 family)
MPGRQEVRRHLRLANGFMATAVIRHDSGEFQIRNALSRSYYALFHVCHAWLAMENVPLTRRKNRRDLFEGIRRTRGKAFADRLESFWLLRKKADYDEPVFFASEGDLDKLRRSAQEDRSRMEAEFQSYASEVESSLEPR